MEVHQIARKVRRHIVLDTIVEGIQTEAVPAVLALALKPDVKVDGLLRFQIGVADPVIAETRAIQCHRCARIHLPVVVEFTHARLSVSRAKIRLEAAV